MHKMTPGKGFPCRGIILYAVNQPDIDVSGDNGRQSEGDADLEEIGILDFKAFPAQVPAARSKLPRMRSFSASARIFSCCLMVVVSVPVIIDTISMTTAEERHSGVIRSKA